MKFTTIAALACLGTQVTALEQTEVVALAQQDLDLEAVELAQQDFDLEAVALAQQDLDLPWDETDIETQESALAQGQTCKQNKACSLCQQRVINWFKSIIYKQSTYKAEAWAKYTACYKLISTTPNPAPTPTPNPTPEPTDDNDDDNNTVSNKDSSNNNDRNKRCAQRIHELVNQHRQANNRRQFIYSEKAAEKCQPHVTDMINKGQLSHDGARARANQVGEWSSYAENVAYTTLNGNFDKACDKLFYQWKGSKGHNANMLSTNTMEEGIAIQTKGNRVWACQFFIRLRKRY